MTIQRPRIPGRRLLHSPGPSPVPDAVLQAMTNQPMDLADPRVDANIAACEAGIRALVGSLKADVLFFISNGHGVWESVVENLAAPGEAVLIPGTGHFSEQWALQTEGLGRRVVRTPWNPGWPMDMAAIEQVLRDDKAHAIKAVFAVHTDTASSVTNDLMAVRRAMDAARHPALLVADVVASLGCAPYDMEAVGADVTLGASQKGLMCPPGIGILALNDRAVAAAEANHAPRFYWDWARRRGDLNYRKFCGTPPHSLMQGLEAALDLIQQEGLPHVHRRHAELAGAVQAAVEGWREGGALDFFCQDPAVRSVSVTTITIPEGLAVDALRETARERFQVSIAGGLGPMTGKAFRIGHLGDQNAANILGAIAGVEAALVVHGVPVGQGGTRRALMHLAGRQP